MIARYEIYKKNSILYRVLDLLPSGEVLLIDCIKQTMPIWVDETYLSDSVIVPEDDFFAEMGECLENLTEIDAVRLGVMRERYTMVCDIVPLVGDTKQRTIAIAEVATVAGVSKQTIRNYLCRYLAWNDVRALIPAKRVKDEYLTEDERNMRWSLNKFFYNSRKLSLRESYHYLLKEKYCDSEGKLLEKYPSFYQYRYFYRKTRKLQNYLISRNGIKKYQRDHRPLLGDGVQQFAKGIGTGMVDATICDIYLVSEEGQLVGRPILTACVDAYSGLCLGYTLSWEGGIYSLRGLMLNVIADKTEYCRDFGIEINEDQWPSHHLPGKIVSDRGSEYVGDTFSQISELGVTLVNLPSFRPELKGPVEKFFDLIQKAYKPLLKGKGIIEPDFAERGSRDYRKDACLTMRQFEQIVIRCIVNYNSAEILENFPYDEYMLDSGVKPYSNTVWEWGMLQSNKNIINISREKLVKVLLPRTDGKFSKSGLLVNNLRYKHFGYTEKYLRGDKVVVAYNPDDVSFVWLLEKGKYIQFELIETRFKGESLEKVQEHHNKKKAIIKEELGKELQSKLDLISVIEDIAANGYCKTDINLKNIRKNRRKEQVKHHIDYLKGDSND